MRNCKGAMDMSEDMEFNISLVPPSLSAVSSALARLHAEALEDDQILPVDFDKERDYFTTVMNACVVLQETDCKFTMSGFGNSSWPLDIEYDMSLLVEGMPECMSNLGKSESGELEMFSQGVDIRISFAVDGEVVGISRSSGPEWLDPGIVHRMSLSQVKVVFQDLAYSFAVSLEMIDARASNATPFSSWKAHRWVGAESIPGYFG